MKKENSFFDDFSKLMSSASGAMMDMKREIETIIHTQMESWMDKMQLVTREEFEAVKAMAEKARKENVALAKRLDTLEGKTPARAKKPAAKKTGPTKGKAKS